MGSDLYRVTVAEKQDRTVRLKVDVVHPDSNYLPDEPSFALMVLRESTTHGKDAPLALEMSHADSLDQGWMRLYTRGFIEQVTAKIESGSGEATTKADWIKGSLTITVTDPAWISHLTVGMGFDSAAFSVVSDCEPCAPIRPGQVDPSAKAPEPFISAPGAMWNTPGLPRVVRLAAYSASAYRTVSPRKGTFSANSLKDLDRQVVLTQGEYDESPRLATLVLVGDSVHVLNGDEGSHGSSQSTTYEGSIGLAELIPGKRLGSKVRLSRLVDRLHPVIQSATVQGTEATFRIAIPPAHTDLLDLPEERKLSLGLTLLLTPLTQVDYSVGAMLTPSPLSWTVEREVLKRLPPEERQSTSYIDGQMVVVGDCLPQVGRLAPRFARGFVAKVEVTAPPVERAASLDGMSEAEGRAFLEQPDRELLARVTPHHAVFLQHLSAPFPPRTIEYVSDAEAWEGQPASPETAPTTFGRKPAPEPTQTPMRAAPSSSNQSSGERPPILKWVGIGCGGLILLMMLCLIGSALFSH